MLPCMEALLKGETWPHGQGENIPAGWKMDPQIESMYFLFKNEDIPAMLVYQRVYTLED